MTNKVESSKDKDSTKWPEYWFVKLMRSDREGDFHAAARAQKELEKLGWDVKRKEADA